MYKFVCAYCGKTVVAVRPNMKYCDDFCKANAASMRRRKQVKGNDCVFNSGVECDDQTKCGSCGWNPEVIKQRALNR